MREQAKAILGVRRERPVAKVDIGSGGQRLRTEGTAQLVGSGDVQADSGEINGGTVLCGEVVRKRHPRFRRRVLFEPLITACLAASRSCRMPCRNSNEAPT